MKRYYYTDVRIASLMESLHKIRQESIFNDGRKYYIHPDYYPMLEPQVDDLVQIGDKVYWIMDNAKLYYDNERKLEHNFILKDYAQEYYDDAMLKIIQRNNKAWFEPEVEE